MATNKWRRVGEGLRRNVSSRVIFSNISFKNVQIRKSLRTTDKTLARNRLTELRRDLEAGVVRRRQNTTVKEISENFLNSLQTKAAKTQASTRSNMKFFVEAFGNKNPRDLKPMEITEWLNQHQDKREFGNLAYNKYLNAIRHFYDFLIKNDFADENPVKEFPPLKNDSKPKYTPGTKEVIDIIRLVRSRGFNPVRIESADFIEFMALTGQGRAETANAQWLDVKWDAKQLNLFRVKTSSPHVIPLFPALKAFLLKRYEASDKRPESRIFKIKDCRESIKNACRTLNIPHLGHHAFRRYFITQRLMEGTPANVIAKWIGHRDSGKMILSIYSDIPTSFEQSFADKITLSESPSASGAQP